MKPVGLTAYKITFNSFSIAFVSFGLLLGTALLAAETTMDLGLYRTIYTIWATVVLVTPALCAFILPGNSAAKQNTWILFWTFSFLCYLVHMAYALLVVYQASFEEFLKGQGVFPAIVNVIFTIWWAVDVFLAWFYARESRWVTAQRVAAHIFIGLTFFASAVILKHGFINVLGVLMTICVLICLMMRLDAARKQIHP